ncbi:hypothetical protein FRC07_013622 [Ceratobasidium sp. 392]|nr:hypothetical protein FRC07_013622 [Ceratobasidium sp. 392]
MVVHIIISVNKLLDNVEAKLDCPLMTNVDLLGSAVAHGVKSLRPSNREEPISDDLFKLVQAYTGRFHAALAEYKADREIEHFYHYFVNIAYDISWECPDDTIVDLMQRHEAALKEEITKHRKSKRQDTRIRRNERMRELGKLHGLRSVGHLDPERTPFNVLCVDAYSHHKLESLNIVINGVDNDNAQSVPESLADPRTKAKDKARPEAGKGKAAGESDPKVPPAALDSPFPREGFVDSAMLTAANFTTYHHGTVYGFAQCTDGTYSMVWAVQFSPIGSFSDVEQEAVDVFIEYMRYIEPHAHEVKNNRAANGNISRRMRSMQAGDIIMNRGPKPERRWRPGRTREEAAGEYTMQSLHDKHNPDGYINMHEAQELVNVSWMVLQERLSPRAVRTNVETLADTPVPLFGSHDSDISTHGPSMGSNMSASTHDNQGRNFANSMHTDMDIDSLPEFRGKILTFGQWLNVKNGKLIEGQELNDAIPDGFFVLPGYRVAFNLGGAAVVTAIWRGGMDLHGTTTSTVDLDSGVTRWGMSIQTNKKLPTRLQSGKGAIFGAYDKLRACYEAIV